MPNDEARTNDEIRMSKMALLAFSSLGHLGFFRHSTFVLRHFAPKRFNRMTRGHESFPAFGDKLSKGKRSELSCLTVRKRDINDGSVKASLQAKRDLLCVIRVGI